MSTLECMQVSVVALARADKKVAAWAKYNKAQMFCTKTMFVVGGIGWRQLDALNLKNTGQTPVLLRLTAGKFKYLSQFWSENDN